MHLPPEITVSDAGSCPLCASHAVAVSIVTRDRFVGMPGDFRVVECGECGLARLSPRPDAETLARHYPECYPMYAESSVKTRKENPISAAIRTFIRNAVDQVHISPSTRKRSSKLKSWIYSRYSDRVLRGFERHIPRHVNSGKVLDVGCGGPTFLLLMRRVGWEVAGLEVNKFACQKSNEVLGAGTVLNGKLSDRLLEPESFDYVHMSHVLEHLDDPLSELKECFRLLRPGGIIFIETPNFASFGRKTFGTYWLNMDSPRHLLLFTPNTLNRALHGAGLPVEKLTTYTWDDGTYPWEYTFELEEQLGELLPDRPHKRPPQSSQQIQRAYQAAIGANALSGDVLCCWGRKPTP